MTVRALDRPILVSDAGVVAGRRHAVVGDKLFVAPRQILLRFAIQVAESCRQAVAAVLLGHPSECPQRILQTLRQRHEALAAKDDMGVLEAGECKAEVVKPMVEWLPSDGDAKLAHVGKVGKAKPAWWMLLSEDDVLFGAVHGPPGSNTPFQRPTHAWTYLGMATAHLLEDGDGPDARRRRQHRNNRAVPYTSQWIGAPAAAWRLLLGWQPRISFDPIGGGSAEPGLRRSGGRGVGVARTHIQPHLTVVDVEAGQALILPVTENQMLTQPL